MATTIQSMVGVIASHGGDILGLSSTSVLVSWTSAAGPGDSAGRAAACGLQLLNEFNLKAAEKDAEKDVRAAEAAACRSGGGGHRRRRGTRVCQPDAEPNPKLTEYVHRPTSTSNDSGGSRPHARVQVFSRVIPHAPLVAPYPTFPFSLPALTRYARPSSLAPPPSLLLPHPSRTHPSSLDPSSFR